MKNRALSGTAINSPTSSSNKYSDIVAVTARSICQKKYDDNHIPYLQPTEPLLNRIRQLCNTDIKFIILREKDLPENEYIELAEAALNICSSYNRKLVLHSCIRAAEMLNHRHIHLPLHMLDAISCPKNNTDSYTDDCSDHLRCNSRMYKLSLYETLGVSVHSVDEARHAEALGATYLTAGHIFDTDCKKGIPGRGLQFLSDVCSAVNIPVYAIGGITEDNLACVIDAGAKGGCMMSGLM